MARDLDAPRDAAPAQGGGRDLAPPGGSPSSSAPPPQQPTLDAANTFGVHAARHLAFGLGDKITALVQALSDKAADKTGKVTIGDAYKRDLAFLDKTMDASDEAHPVARWAGNATGIAGNAAALAALAPIRAALAARGLVPAAETVAPAVGTLAGLIRGSTEGAKLGTVAGGVGGYGGDRSDSMLGTLANVAAGGGFGLVGGTVLGGLGGAVSGKLAARAAPQEANKLAQAIQELQQEAKTPAGETQPLQVVSNLPMFARSAKAVPEAITLRKYGIPLTLRQMNPDGPLAEISEASERVPFLQGAVKAQEKAPLQAWRDVALRQAMPGEGPMVGGDVADKLGDIQGQISSLYKAVENEPAKIAAVHPDTGKLVTPNVAFKAILDDPEYQADPSDIKIVKGVMDKQLFKLNRTLDAATQKPGLPSSINAGMLMNMRSALRSAAQDAYGQQGGEARAQMFTDAANALGGGIKASLSPDKLELLNQADSAYSDFSRLANAAKKAATQVGEGEFSPQRLSGELAQAYGRKFATDSEAGGNLRELARAGKVVFTPRDVKTGHGELLKAPLGATLGALIHSANQSPAAQQAFTAAAQRAAQSSANDFAVPSAGAFENALTRYLQTLPAGTSSAEALNQLARARASQGGP